MDGLTPADEGPGRRLHDYIKSEWRRKRGKGGMRGFLAVMGITPQRAYAWFRGETEPQLGSITKIAQTLEVSRVEVLAAMDGMNDEPSEVRMRRIAREEFQALMGAEIAAERLRVLLGGQRGSRGGSAPQQDLDQ